MKKIKSPFGENNVGTFIIKYVSGKKSGYD